MITNEEFKKEITDFLAQTGMSPTIFGKKVKKDPSFYCRVMKGQEVKEEGKRKVLEFMKSFLSEREKRHEKD